MSLIQEALRRQDSDGPPQLRADNVSIGPPPVPPMRPPPEKKNTKNIITIVVVAVVMLGLLGGAFGLLAFVAKSAKPKGGPPSVVAEKADVQPEKITNRKKEVVPEVKETVAEVVIKKEVVPVAEIEKEDAVPEKTPMPIMSKTESPEKTKPMDRDEWPLLELTGVLTKARQEDSAAMINSEIIFVGEQFMGVEILEVNSTGVLMEYKGSKRFLRVGRTMQ